jgi:NADH-quinone oxidoreductase subunit M
MTPEMHFAWLELSILIPLIGAILCARASNHRAAYRIATLVSGLTLLCAVGEWVDFATLDTFTAHDHWDVFRYIFSRNIFVVDELSAPLLPLSSLLYFLAIFSTPLSKASRFPFRLTLIAESICIATLSCTNVGMIIALLALSMLPPWLELHNRQQSTRIFSLHMGLYTSLLFVGWLMIEFSRDSESISLPASGILLIASLLRAGVIPVHPWLTDLFEKSSFGTAILFVTPMTGAYAVMRLVMPVAPSWAMQSIAILSLITAVYAAGMALIQVEMRRFYCFLFLSQSSLVLAGLEISTVIGMTGALYVWISVGVSLGGLGLIMRVIEARIGSVSFDRYYGLHDHMPLLASLFLLTGLSSVGFPGTLGFVGLELLVEGTVEFYPLVGAAVVFAAALNGIVILKAYFHLFTGTRHFTTISLQPRKAEKRAAILFGLLVLGGGLWPQPGVQSRYHAATELLKLRESPGDADCVQPVFSTSATLVPQASQILEATEGFSSPPQQRQGKLQDAMQ